LNFKLIVRPNPVTYNLQKLLGFEALNPRCLWPSFYSPVAGTVRRERERLNKKGQKRTFTSRCKAAAPFNEYHQGFNLSVIMYAVDLKCILVL
jgi:hypothetical protein